MNTLNKKALMATGLVMFGMASPAYAKADYHDLTCDLQCQINYKLYGSCVRKMYILGDECGHERTQRVAEYVREMRPTVGLTQEERTVYFDFNRATLTQKAEERLDTLAYVLKSNQSIKEARIVGYADRIGSDDYNQRLSQKRAEAVRNYLVAQGYTNARVTETRWVGETEPSTNCTANASRAQQIDCLRNDRRVEIEIEYREDGQQMSEARYEYEKTQ